MGIKDYQWLEGVTYLFKRRNRMPWLVTMEVKDFIDLVKGV